MGFMKKVGTFFRKWSLKRFAYNLYWLGKYNMEEREFDAAYKIKDELLEECARELEDYKKELVQLQVLDGRQTIALLASHPKSDRISPSKNTTLHWHRKCWIFWQRSGTMFMWV